MSMKLVRVIVIEEDSLQHAYGDMFLKGDIPSGTTILLYDTLLSDESKSLVERFKKQSSRARNIEVEAFEKEGAERTACYNEALKSALEKKAELITFSRPGNSTESKSYHEAMSILEKGKYSLVSYWPFQEIEGKKFNQIYFSGFDKAYNALENPFHISMTIDGYIMSTEKLAGLSFDEESHTGEELFVLEVLNAYTNYYILREKMYVRDFLANDFYNYRPMYLKDYYTAETRDRYIPMLQKYPESKLIQGGVLELIQLKILQNANDRDKNILMGTEVDDFYEQVTQAIKLIDDDVLVQYEWNHRRTLPRFMSIKYLRLKYDDMSLVANAVKDPKKKGRWLAECKGQTIESFDKAVVNFKIFDLEDGFIHMEGELANVYYADFDKIKLTVHYGQNVIDVERNEIYSLVKHFSRTTKNGYTFSAKVPVDKLAARDKIYFEYSYDGAKIRPGITFLKFQTKLANKIPESYWVAGEHIISYDDKKYELTLVKNTKFTHFRKEAKLLFRIAGQGMKRSMKRGYNLARFGNAGAKSRIKTWQIIRLRLRMKLGKYFHKNEMGAELQGNKPIWITFDQLFKGGDNGQYFFEYMRKNVSDIRTYYILNSDAKEYKKLKKSVGNVLPFGAYKTKVMGLRADMIFATRVDIRLYLGFNEEDEIYVRDLFRAKVVCLQHGLTIQKIAQYQNKFYDNTKHYFCVSPKEVENITHPIYGYTEDMISMTGAPRYDGLTGEPKKRILITPTWRRNVTAGTNEKGKQHDYSVNFKRTTYYQIYNSVINDKILIETAKKTGYKIVYLVHPILSPQADDYDRNDYVEIVKGTEANYEEMLKESALMVTDYSGIQFDFAYMRRPLIYYHPKELPPQYEESDTGFGPVCTTKDELVDELVKAMENGCALSEDYKAAIDSFFPFDDQNACERVYKAAKEL